MNKVSKIVAGTLSTAAIVVSSAGCGKFTEPFKDAPVSGHNGEPAEIMEMPDGFNNVSEKCDGHASVSLRSITVTTATARWLRCAIQLVAART